MGLLVCLEIRYPQNPLVTDSCPQDLGDRGVVYKPPSFWQVLQGLPETVMYS